MEPLSPEEVRRAVAKVGRPRGHNRPAIERDEIKRYLAVGFTLGQIGTLMGMSRSSVYRELHRPSL